MPVNIRSEDPKPSGLPVTLASRSLHEVFAFEAGDLAAAAGFAAASVRLAARGRPILWIEQEGFTREAGRLHPAGLSEIGIDPGAVVLVKARDAPGALKAADDAARCEGLGAVVLEIWGDPARLDLTATRRLSLGAERSGAAVVLLRAAASPRPSAAFTRWSVKPLPSRPLPANAPGPPCFAVSLLKHRGGAPPQSWNVEWDRDAGLFRIRSAAGAPDAAHPRFVVSLSAGRSLAAGGEPWRRAG
jgi:protein ImuA